MAADWGVLLVDAVLREKTLKPVIEAGIDPDMLGSPGAPALKAIMEFADAPDTRGLVPPRAYIDQRVPIIEWPTDDEPPAELNMLCQICLDIYVEREIESVMADIVDIAEDNPRHALSIGRQKLQELNTKIGSGGSDVDLPAQLGDILENHFDTIDSGGLTGLPYPWEPLNEAVMGMQKGDLIVLYGLPKSMKTWVALYITLYAYVNTQTRVLIVAPEMSKEKLALRTAAILAEEDYTQVKRGFPGHEEEQEQAKRRMRVIQVARDLQDAEEVQDKQGRRLLLAKSHLGLGGNPIGDLEAKIDAYEPSLVYIDSAYMLSTDRDWKAISKFLQEVKLLAEAKGITIILTSQENLKEAVKAAHAGKSPGAATASFSQAFIEFADLAIRVVKKSNGPGKTLVSLHLIASRETTMDGFTINANPGNDFSLHDLKLIQLEDALDVGGGSTPKHKNAGKPTGVSLVDAYEDWTHEDT